MNEGEKDDEEMEEFHQSLMKTDNLPKTEWWKEFSSLMK